MKRYHLLLVFLLVIASLSATNVIGSSEIPRIFVDPSDVSGYDAPAPGSVLSLSINVSDIPEPGLWGYEFYLSLNSTVFSPIIPLNNMNFTANAAFWTTAVTRTSGEDSYGYDAAQGNPAPGSEDGSYFVRANSTNSRKAQITFITEQSLMWSLGTPVNALISFAFRITGNSIATTGNSIGIRVIKPSGVVRTLIPTRSFGTTKPWMYNLTETTPTAFDEIGTYKFQLRVVLKTAETGVDKYVQVGWDDVGLELAPVSVSEGSFLTSDSRNLGKTYFAARYSGQGYLYVSDSIMAQPYLDGSPVKGSGHLASVSLLVGFGSATLNLYNTTLVTLGYPPSYPAVPIYPHAAGGCWFSNELVGEGLSATPMYGEIEPGLFSTPRLTVQASAAYVENLNETVVSEGLTEDYQRVRVLVAGDEEYISHTWPFATDTGNNETLSWQAYAERQIRYASYYFNVNFDISLEAVQYTTWTSDNNILAVSPQNLVNVQTQLGWTGQSPFLFQGVVVDILIAVTGQYDKAPGGLAGLADIQHSAVLVQPQAWWGDDNLIQHEVSHLYDALDHVYENDPGYFEDCIMSYRLQYVGNHTDNGFTVSINDNVPTNYVTHNYHIDCYNIVYANRFSYGEWISNPPPQRGDVGVGGAGGIRYVR